MMGHDLERMEAWACFAWLPFGSRDILSWSLSTTIQHVPLFIRFTNFMILSVFLQNTFTLFVMFYIKYSCEKFLSLRLVPKWSPEASQGLFTRQYALGRWSEVMASWTKGESFTFEKPCMCGPLLIFYYSPRLKISL